MKNFFIMFAYYTTGQSLYVGKNINIMIQVIKKFYGEMNG